jgi:hypothetical protein
MANWINSAKGRRFLMKPEDMSGTIRNGNESRRPRHPIHGRDPSWFAECFATSPFRVAASLAVAMKLFGMTIPFGGESRRAIAIGDERAKLSVGRSWRNERGTANAKGYAGGQRAPHQINISRIRETLAQGALPPRLMVVMAVPPAFHRHTC